MDHDVGEPDASARTRFTAKGAVIAYASVALFLLIVALIFIEFKIAIPLHPGAGSPLIATGLLAALYQSLHTKVSKPVVKQYLIAAAGIFLTEIVVLILEDIGFPSSLRPMRSDVFRRLLILLFALVSMVSFFTYSITRVRKSMRQEEPDH